MIMTLTFNPAVDQTCWVQRLEPGRIHRVADAQVDPAGKGINVSRMAHRLGWPTIAFGFLAGEMGLLVEKALREEEVEHHFVQVSGQTRVNVTVVDTATNGATSFFGPGPLVGVEHLARLDAALEFWLPAARVLVLAGSLPPGVPEDAYTRYVQAARDRGIKVILDADGAPLRAGLSARPDLIKPNVVEAEALLGRSLNGLSEIVEAAHELGASAGAVVLSMGAQGAICVQGTSAWRVVSPSVERRSTIGSGDSLVAGLAVALARGEDLASGLRIGAAAGAATAMTPGTALGSAADAKALMPRVTIEQL